MADVFDTEGMDTDELLRHIAEQQKAQRDEIQTLRDQIAKSQPPSPRGATARIQSQDELIAQRMEEINQHSHYCPGCGALYTYPRECRGRSEAPHPPIDVISTDELKSGDPSQHTPAPHTDNKSMALTGR